MIDATPLNTDGELTDKQLEQFVADGLDAEQHAARLEESKRRNAAIDSARGGQPLNRETVTRCICKSIDMQFVTKEQLEQMVTLEINFPGVR
ncbi:MAG: hypothetical protein UY50_C0024G0018 [Parcubacteria group bacterium GW2011_GWA2_49_9]|nr:MAG: hypothetical protein UY50_C0024G0018 [Parcubacteria group bacterium GW2011_GWA2_49_9]